MKIEMPKKAMISKKEFVEELDAIIKRHDKCEIVNNALNDLEHGFFHSIPNPNEETAIKLLSGLIGLGISNDSPLMDWFYAHDREGRKNKSFWVAFGPVGDRQLLETPEQFYDFYVKE